MGQARAAIYHCTDVSSKRPVVYQKELERIKGLASSMGYRDAVVYLDMSIRKRGQVQAVRLWEDISGYEALLMKDFSHLEKNTGEFISSLAHLAGMGVEVHTVEDGSYVFEQPPFGKPLKAAAYYCAAGSAGYSAGLHLDVMDYFVRTHTRWELSGRYADMSGNIKDGSQGHLQELISDRDRYGIVLVQSFLDIHWRTAKFCTFRNQLRADIYSMHEDLYLRYRKE